MKPVLFTVVFVFFPDSSLKNYSGLPRSRQGAKAAPHPGEYTGISSSQIVCVKYSDDLYMTSMTCVCVLRHYGLFLKPGPTPAQWNTHLWSSSCTSARPYCWVWVCCTTRSYRSYAQVQRMMFDAWNQSVNENKWLSFNSSSKVLYIKHKESFFIFALSFMCLISQTYFSVCWAACRATWTAVWCVSGVWEW